MSALCGRGGVRDGGAEVGPDLQLPDEGHRGLRAGDMRLAAEQSQHGTDSTGRSERATRGMVIPGRVPPIAGRRSAYNSRSSWAGATFADLMIGLSTAAAAAGTKLNPHVTGIQPGISPR